MKKILALILILALCSVAMFGCFKNNGNGGNNNDNGSENGGESGGENEGGDNPFTPEFEGDDGNPDNIDADGWTPVK